MPTVIPLQGQLAVLAATLNYKAISPSTAISLGDYQYVQIGGVYVTQNSTNQIATFNLQTAIVNDDAAYISLSGGPTIAASQTGWASLSNPSGQEFLDWVRPIVTFASQPTAGTVLAYTLYVIAKRKC